MNATIYTRQGRFYSGRDCTNEIASAIVAQLEETHDVEFVDLRANGSECQWENGRVTGDEVEDWSNGLPLTTADF